MARRLHRERHKIGNTGWLRAAVLGANDGVLSTASLILGVATATHSHGSILIAGVSGLVAGALSMAAGEYVSVSSQADVEKADLAKERQELATDKDAELRELAGIYVKRGLTRELAMDVAVQLTAKDALAAHARDELGITEETTARPIQAALASAASFAVGAAVPIVASLLSPIAFVVATVYAISLAALAGLGALGAQAGGAPLLTATLRVVFWGIVAMAISAGIGTLFHVQV
ncbi:MAG TPA: VIT family protein [Rhizomicrobium sp.]|jgi:VIT1/CCC1 family predicted Fe2+/Mn2+ transporter|nr:VIT family protein [Rhizomicrobium sp.]